MTIDVHGYTQDGSIDATIDGVRWTVPDASDNRLRMTIAEWEDAGNTIPPFTPPPPTLEEYEASIQALVDETARTRNYRDGALMASYISSTVPGWAAEAQAFVAWRDSVWVYAYTELAKVRNGERLQPSVEDFVAEIAPIVWPTAQEE